MAMENFAWRIERMTSVFALTIGISLMFLCASLFILAMSFNDESDFDREIDEYFRKIRGEK